MRVIIYFMCLFTLLLGGYGYMHASSHHHSIRYSAVAHVEKTHEDDCAVIEEAPLQQEMQYLFCEEEEDEDDRQTPAKKDLLNTSYYSRPSYTILLSYFYNCTADPSFGCRHSAYKYIQQRALRI